MELREMKRCLRVPGVREQLLGGYRGPASVGITTAPNSAAYAFFVHVESRRGTQIRDDIELEGEVIQVVVQEGFESPHLASA